MDGGTFFKRLALVMRDNPPYPEDGPMLEKLKKLGVEPGKDFNISKVDPAIAHGLNRAVKDCWDKIAAGITKMKNVNGWVDLFTLGRYSTDYETQAGVAWVGLGADLKEDTLYPTAFVDGDGELFDPSRK
jgi:hypothetical protein